MTVIRDLYDLELSFNTFYRPGETRLFKSTCIYSHASTELRVNPETSSLELTWVHRSGGIPSHMRIRIRAVPTFSRNRSCSKHPGPDHRRRWSSLGSWCSRDTCSISGATRGPWRAPARQQKRRRRSGDSLYRVEPWLSRCRLRWCEEPHRCAAKDRSYVNASFVFVLGDWADCWTVGITEKRSILSDHLPGILDQTFQFHAKKMGGFGVFFDFNFYFYF